MTIPCEASSFLGMNYSLSSFETGKQFDVVHKHKKTWANKREYNIALSTFFMSTAMLNSLCSSYEKLYKFTESYDVGEEVFAVGELFVLVSLYNSNHAAAGQSTVRYLCFNNYIPIVFWYI